MKKLYDKLITIDKFGLLRGMFFLIIIMVVVFWALYSIISSHTEEQYKDRLKDEIAVAAVQVMMVLLTDHNATTV